MDIVASQSYLSTESKEENEKKGKEFQIEYRIPALEKKQTFKRKSTGGKKKFVWKKNPDCKNTVLIVHCFKWKYKLIYMWEGKGAFQLYQWCSDALSLQHCSWKRFSSSVYGGCWTCTNVAPCSLLGEVLQPPPGIHSVPAMAVAAWQLLSGDSLLASGHFPWSHSHNSACKGSDTHHCQHNNSRAVSRYSKK